MSSEEQLRQKRRLKVLSRSANSQSSENDNQNKSDIKEDVFERFRLSQNQNKNQKKILLISKMVGPLTLLLSYYLYHSCLIILIITLIGFIAIFHNGQKSSYNSKKGNQQGQKDKTQNKIMITLEIFNKVLNSKKYFTVAVNVICSYIVSGVILSSIYENILLGESINGENSL